jgi:hypothetical protein
MTYGICTTTVLAREHYFPLVNCCIEHQSKTKEAKYVMCLLDIGLDYPKKQLCACYNSIFLFKLVSTYRSCVLHSLVNFLYSTSEQHQGSNYMTCLLDLGLDYPKVKVTCLL